MLCKEVIKGKMLFQVCALDEQTPQHWIDSQGGVSQARVPTVRPGASISPDTIHQARTVEAMVEA